MAESANEFTGAPQPLASQCGQSHFSIQADLKPPLGVVTLKGDLDMATAPRLGAVLDWLATRVTAVEFDCSGVTFVDVAGIRPILALDRARCEASVTSPSRWVAWLLELIDHQELVSQAQRSTTTTL